MRWIAFAVILVATACSEDDRPTCESLEEDVCDAATERGIPCKGACSNASSPDIRDSDTCERLRTGDCK
jgi:hypothetical protein